MVKRIGMIAAGTGLAPMMQARHDPQDLVGPGLAVSSKKPEVGPVSRSLMRS